LSKKLASSTGSTHEAEGGRKGLRNTELPTQKVKESLKVPPNQAGQ